MDHMVQLARMRFIVRTLADPCGVALRGVGAIDLNCFGHNAPCNAQGARSACLARVARLAQCAVLRCTMLHRAVRVAHAAHRGGAARAQVAHGGGAGHHGGHRRGAAHGLPRVRGEGRWAAVRFGAVGCVRAYAVRRAARYARGCLPCAGARRMRRRCGYLCVGMGWEQPDASPDCTDQTLMQIPIDQSIDRSASTSFLGTRRALVVCVRASCVPHTPMHMLHACMHGRRCCPACCAA